jgi:hypothetical protein
VNAAAGADARAILGERGSAGQRREPAPRSITLPGSRPPPLEALVSFARGDRFSSRPDDDADILPRPAVARGVINMPTVMLKTPVGTERRLVS